MTVYFTSDTHLGHINIIKYCNRPFSNVDEMNEAIVNAWNSVVTEEDVVVHFGDVTLLSKPEKSPDLCKLFHRLKGRKVLVPGNHDMGKMRRFFETIGWYVVKGDRRLPAVVLGGLHLSHVPPSSLPEGVKLSIHGHTHGEFKRDGWVDVGVDAVGFVPVAASSIIKDQSDLAALEDWCKRCYLETQVGYQKERDDADV